MRRGTGANQCKRKHVQKAYSQRGVIIVKHRKNLHPKNVHLPLGAVSQSVRMGFPSMNQKRSTKSTSSINLNHHLSISTITYQPQPSSIKHLASISNHQSPNISQSGSITEHQPPNIEHQACSTNHQPSRRKHQTSSINHKHRSIISHQSSGINHQSPTIQHQPIIASITAPVRVKYDRQDGVDIQRQLVGRQLDQVRMSPDGLQNQGVKVLLSAVVQGKHETTPSLGARGVGCGL